VSLFSSTIPARDEALATEVPVRAVSRAGSARLRRCVIAGIPLGSDGQAIVNRMLEGELASRALRGRQPFGTPTGHWHRSTFNRNDMRPKWLDC